MNAEAPWTPAQDAAIKALTERMALCIGMLNRHICDLQNRLYRTRAELIALGGLVAKEGVEIDAEEWEAATSAIVAGRQLQFVFDPLAQRGDELIRRLLAGEDVAAEIAEWEREIVERKDRNQR